MYCLFFLLSGSFAVDLAVECGQCGGDGLPNSDCVLVIKAEYSEQCSRTVCVSTHTEPTSRDSLAFTCYNCYWY